MHKGRLFSRTGLGRGLCWRSLGTVVLSKLNTLGDAGSSTDPSLLESGSLEAFMLTQGTLQVPLLLVVS